MISLGIGLWTQIVSKPPSGDTTPGGAADVILLESGDGLLLESGGFVNLNTTIPAQSAASELDGTEWIVIVQSGTSKKVSAATLATFLRVGA